MMKLRKSVIVLSFGFVLLATSSVTAETITKPNTFTDGTPAMADEVNANFDTVYDQVNKVGSEITIDDVNGRVGIGTTNPQTTLDVNGTLKLAKNSSEPFACDAAHEGAIGLTSAFTTCVCNGTNWVFTSDGQSDCHWWFGTVTSAGQIWMDRNLGASQVATSSTDSAAYGDLYQWGRLADGHQLRSSSTTSITSSTDVPGHGSFITRDANPFDWRIPENNSLWQGVPGPNNPCPAGFRLPTETELETERVSWASNNSAGAFASPLKLVVAGYRQYNNGYISSTGSLGIYWSSTISTPIQGQARQLNISSGDAGMHPYYRASGQSVRCIQD